MKITIENTAKIVHLNGLSARVWEGHTESGIQVFCFITLIACKLDADQTEFLKDLQVQKEPSPELQGYPLRMII